MTIDCRFLAYRLFLAYRPQPHAVHMQLVAEATARNATVMFETYEKNRNKMAYAIRTIRSRRSVFRGFLAYVRHVEPTKADRPFDDIKAMMGVFIACYGRCITLTSYLH